MKAALFAALLSLGLTQAAVAQDGGIIGPVPTSVGQAAVGQIPGTTTNDNAASGKVGEFITANATGVSLSNASNANITTISLTAGDWDVSGNVQFSPSGATVTSASSGISTTTATFPALAAGGYAEISVALNGSVGTILVTPTYRISLSGTTTVYLVGEMNFSAGTVTANGYIGARRAR
jgi:hypothetical protein